ncbi:MAG: hypothetical protein GC206_14735 [Alphaproteobacteria bacterium]|nr:hypothetical protein [Alphaproteobacteria bacterium]
MLEAVLLYCVAALGVPPADVVDRYIAAYNAHDVGAMRQTFDENAPIHVWSAGRDEPYRHALADVLSGIEDGVFANHPNIRVNASDRVVVGARVAQVETYAGGEEDWSASLAVYTIADGCIASREVYW